MDKFDLCVIGGGPGGYVAAIRAAQLGFNTCIVEKRKQLGGTCLNIGCIPSKALLESSELFATIKHESAIHGIGVEKATIDIPTLMGRKTKIVKDLTDGLSLLMKKNRITVAHGTARLIDPQRIAISGSATQEIQAERIILATGSEPVELPFLPFDGERIVSSTEALSFDTVPERLVVVGAGAIGLELGSVWSRLGAQVTVVEVLDGIVPTADAEVSKVLQRTLKKQGVDFKLGCKVVGAKRQVDAVALDYEDTAQQMQQIVADKVLVAVGRRVNADDLGLDSIGVATERGRVVVDAQYRTNVSSIYAIGDLIGGAMLAHKAEEEGVAVAEILAGKPGHVNYAAIPNIVYTWPELASVGLSEAQAKEQGFDVSVGRYKFAANGRAKTLGSSDGMAKLIADKKTDRILGAHIVGPRASDMIAELVIALEFSASSEDIARTCHAHPTLSEIIKEAAMAIDGRVIHG